MLQGKGGASSGHRNFSDQAFLAGVGVSDSLAMFSVRLHDIAYDTTFRADKSVFFFKDWIFCLGSGISSGDPEHPVVTTLFQDFSGNGQVHETGIGWMAEDGSFLYAVKNGTVRTSKDGLYTRTWIEHGPAPENGSYGYFILKDKDAAEAARLLSDDSPVEIIEADSDAHIIRKHDPDIVCGAIFDPGKTFSGTPVVRTNIPLAYIFENPDSIQDTAARLTVCEPDMRRPYKAHMGLLTDEDVIAEEKPHLTTVVLDGHYTLNDGPEDAVLSYDEDSGTTSISFTTIRGNNYSFKITGQK